MKKKYLTIAVITSAILLQGLVFARAAGLVMPSSGTDFIFDWTPEHPYHSCIYGPDQNYITSFGDGVSQPTYGTFNVTGPLSGHETDYGQYYLDINGWGNCIETNLSDEVARGHESTDIYTYLTPSGPPPVATTTAAITNNYIFMFTSMIFFLIELFVYLIILYLIFLQVNFLQFGLRDVHQMCHRRFRPGQ